jgi:phage repressor protein C with HTH and peptisase S24 domain
MIPMLHEGDTILVRVGAEARPGDVVVAYRPEQGYVVKRVARLSAEEMILSSLNAAYDDVAVPRDPRLVVGTVVLRWCAHGHAARARTTS